MTWFGSGIAPCVSAFRCERKCHGYLLLACTLLLIAVPVNARPKEAESDIVLPLDEGLPLSAEYGNVDNVEFHQARVVDGVLQEDHPIIMYKEDFVSEDFVPKTNRTHRWRKHKGHTHRRRRIGDQSDSEQYNPLAPEKIYFDKLSPAPIVASDEVKVDASAKMPFEVISLADGNSNIVASDDETKRMLKNRTKKFNHHRQRRDANGISNGQHIVEKRNAYYSYGNGFRNVNQLSGQAPISNLYAVSYSPYNHFVKHAIAGDAYNGVGAGTQIESRFGGPAETDRVIWRDYTPTRNPNIRLNVTPGTPAPLLRQRTTRSPTAAVTPAPTIIQTEVPAASTAESSLATIFKPQLNPKEPTKSSPNGCIWAISGCCSASKPDERKACFQRFGCSLVFWDYSPCTDQILGNIISFQAKQFN